jgi:LysM repeat protein
MGCSSSVAAVLIWRAILVVVCLALAGCRPAVRGSSDEQKEPYFLAAKKRAEERDYAGAIEYYEKALDVNPRSASAHMELGILYEGQQSDFAAALYHYQKAITLKPDLPVVDIVRQRIEQCKRELAKTVTQLPSTEKMQQELDNLRAENGQMKAQLQAWANYHAGKSAAPTGVIIAPRAAVPAPGGNATRPPQVVAPATNPAVPAAATRTHTIATGETLSRVATKYGVKLSALQRANPNVDSSRLKPGQTVVIPPATP